jgi:hypothetical protein
MVTNDHNEKKPLREFGGRARGVSGRRARRDEHLRLPPLRGRVLFFVLSLAACGFLTWWLWARFKIRFYFIFIPLIGIGGSIFGRPRRWTGGGWEGGRPSDGGDAWEDGQPGGADGTETGEKRRMLENRGDEDADPEDRDRPGDGKT